jgi:hypothetical protein
MGGFMEFWPAMPPTAKFLLLGIVAMFLLSTVRLGRLARRLYRRSGAAVADGTVLNGRANPDALADSAMAGQVFMNAYLEGSARPRLAEGTSPQDVLSMLRSAETRFLYLWENCHTDLRSIRRACSSIALLTCVLVTYDAYPILFEHPGSYNVTAYEALLAEGKLLLDAASFGISACTTLYIVSARFERALGNRRTNWIYFCSRLTNELLRG